MNKVPDLVFVVVAQSVFDFIILAFVLIKMAKIINSQKQAEKDINELWKSHRLLKIMVYGTYNRFVIRVEASLSKNNINTDFSDVILKDE